MGWFTMSNAMSRRPIVSIDAKQLRRHILSFAAGWYSVVATVSACAIFLNYVMR
jgi:hypothetical protein